MSRFLAAYEDLFAKSTDAPVEFGHAGGLAVLSTIALGRRWIERGASRIKPNVFMLLTADSSRDRKSTSVSIAVDIIKEVDARRVGPDDFTAEGLVSFMRHRGGENQQDDEDGEFDTKKIVTKSRIVLPIEEFGTYLAASGSYAKTLAATMCRLYDGRRIEKVRASGKTVIVVEDPLVTMLGGVAYGMLERYADETDWITGFFTRIVWVTPVNRRVPYVTPPPTPTTQRKIVVDAAQSIYNELVTSAHSGVMQLTPNANQIFQTFAENLKIDEKCEDPAVVAQRERLLNVIWKLSILYQIDIDSSYDISDVAVQRACTFAQQAWTSFKLVYARCSGTRQGRLIRRVWEYVSAHGEPSKRKLDGSYESGGVTRRQLYRGLGMSVGDVIPILDMLYHGGIIGHGNTIEKVENKEDKVLAYYIIQPIKKVDE